MLLKFTIAAAGAAAVFGMTGNGLAQVQEKVLYSFCSAAHCADGAFPEGILTFDSAGNLLGTTTNGGSNGLGTIFELSPSQSGGWTESVLYNFGAYSGDGSAPYAGLTSDKLSNLYGTTQYGGSYGEGTVFELSPPSTQGGSWSETILWSLGASGDGKYPFSRVIFDTSGNLYGTTSQGGTSGSEGTVFELVPSGSGQWAENILYSFGPNPENGFDIKSGVVFDRKGNLYGTTEEGGKEKGFGLGVVYKLTPNQQLPWSETVLFSFTRRSGGNPWSGVNFDDAGNLYGTTSAYAGNYGSAYKLSPSGELNFLSLPGPPNAAVPYAGLFISGSSMYGTSVLGGTQNGGSVYKIVGRKETAVYSFCSQPNCADGYQPVSNLTARGNSLFGVTSLGGANGNGVVYQITLGGTLSRKGTKRNSNQHPN